MDWLNSHFLRPSPTAPGVSGDGQSALVDKLGVFPNRSRQLTGPQSLSPGDSTTGPRPQCWDGSLTPSQQPIYNPPEDRWDTNLRNVGNHLQDYTASQDSRSESTFAVWFLKSPQYMHRYSACVPEHGHASRDMPNWVCKNNIGKCKKTSALIKQNTRVVIRRAHTAQIKILVRTKLHSSTIYN
jgi:hypothetical protein